MDAKAWIKRIEADDEHMEALGLLGSGMTFSQLLDEYMSQWQGRDPNQVYRLEHWRQELGKCKLIDISPQLLRQKLKDFHLGKCKRGDGVKRSKTLNKTRSNATVNRHRVPSAALSRMPFKPVILSPIPCTKCPDSLLIIAVSVICPTMNAQNCLKRVNSPPGTSSIYWLFWQPLPA